MKYKLSIITDDKIDELISIHRFIGYDEIPYNYSKKKIDHKFIFDKINDVNYVLNLISIDYPELPFKAKLICTNK